LAAVRAFCARSGALKAMPAGVVSKLLGMEGLLA